MIYKQHIANQVVVMIVVGFSSSYFYYAAAEEATMVVSLAEAVLAVEVMAAVVPALS